MGLLYITSLFRDKVSHLSIYRLQAIYVIVFIMYVNICCYLPLKTYRPGALHKVYIFERGTSTRQILTG